MREAQPRAAELEVRVGSVAAVDLPRVGVEHGLGARVIGALDERLDERAALTSRSSIGAGRSAVSSASRESASAAASRPRRSCIQLR